MVLLKWIGVLLAGVSLLILFALLYEREIWGGAYPSYIVSPSHPDYKVEIYDYDGAPIGSPSFALYVVDTGNRKFLGYFNFDDDPTWSPWNSNLHWSADGKVIYCEDTACRVAYSFEDHCEMIRAGSPTTGSKQSARGLDQMTLNSFLTKHGGGGVMFFSEFNEDPGTLVWHDFVPSENN